jgi:hypothetical protein
MGYQMGAYALGYVDDVRDPMAVVAGVTPGVAPPPTFAGGR